MSALAEKGNYEFSRQEVSEKRCADFLPSVIFTSFIFRVAIYFRLPIPYPTF